jgi:hypothetical protein
MRLFTAPNLGALVAVCLPKLGCLNCAASRRAALSLFSISAAIAGAMVPNERPLLIVLPFVDFPFLFMPADKPSRLPERVRSAFGDFSP